jgi:hypothetical protein
VGLVNIAARVGFLLRRALLGRPVDIEAMLDLIPVPPIAGDHRV